MRNEENVVVVTRFPAIAQHLVNEGVVPHGAPFYDGPVPLNVIKGSTVFGYLPTFLASHAAKYVEVNLGRVRLSPGDDPDPETVRRNIRMTAYEIRRVDL